MSRRSRGRGRLTFKVASDAFSFCAGWTLIFLEALYVEPSRVNNNVLWLAAALLGVPGAREVVARIRIGTDSSESGQASEESRSSSSSSRSTPGGDE